MHARFRPLLLVPALGLSGLAAFGAPRAEPLGSHTWDISEVFSNADGTIQFVELQECCGGMFENGLPGHTLNSNGNSMVIPGGPLPGSTANKHYLLATQAFADLPGAPTPDAIIPAGSVPFFSTSGDTVTYVPWDSWTFGAVPTDGIDSLKRSGTVSANDPTNYSGATGSVDASPPGTPRCFCDAASAPCSNPYATGGCTNSTGVGAIITTSGSASVAAQGSSPLVLRVTQARPDKNCVWLQGGTSVQNAFKDGNLCVGNPTIRLPGFGCAPFPIGTLDSGGSIATDDATFGFDVLAAALCKGDDIAAAVPAVRDYQLWFRDGMGPCGSGSNLSNATQVTWTP